MVVAFKNQAYPLTVQSLPPSPSLELAVIQLEWL